MQSGVVLGYRALTLGLLERIKTRAGPSREGRRLEHPGRPDRRPVGRTVGPRPARRRRDRPGADAQGPGHPVGRWPAASRRSRATTRSAGPAAPPARSTSSRSRPNDRAGQAASKAAASPSGITGSIAAYKAVELLRLLQAEGADVRVLMTPSATEFIGPLTLETLSRHPVDTDVLALQARRPDRPHQHRPRRGGDRRGPGHGPLARAPWPAAWPPTRSRPPAWPPRCR